MKFDTCRSV